VALRVRVPPQAPFVPSAGVAQREEAAGSNPEGCEFESRRRHEHVLLMGLSGGAGAWSSKPGDRVRLPDGPDLVELARASIAQTARVAGRFHMSCREGSSPSSATTGGRDVAAACEASNLVVRVRSPWAAPSASASRPSGKASARYADETVRFRREAPHIGCRSGIQTLTPNPSKRVRFPRSLRTRFICSRDCKGRHLRPRRGGPRGVRVRVPP
jgi:hypothetical protein